MTTDHLGNVHGEGGKFTDKLHSEPGAAAQLGRPVQHFSQCNDQFGPEDEQITDRGQVIDFEDPRLSEALGVNPYDLSETEQRMLRALLDPDVAAEIGDYYDGEVEEDDVDEQFQALLDAYEEIDTDELYTLDQLGGAVCSHRDYRGVFDLIRGSDGSCDAYSVGFDIPGGPRLSRTHEIKYLDPDRGIGTATGLRKAVYIASVIDDDIAQLKSEAKRHALHDVDLAHVDGLGPRARRISEAEAKARLHPEDSFWRVEITEAGPVRRDELGTVRVAEILYGEIKLTGTGARSAEEPVHTGSASFYATDSSGTIYVLDGADRPVLGLLPA